MNEKIERLRRRVDTFQKRRPWAGFPVAVAKKFGDDRAGELAALVAYYAFFSLFPLLLALTTVLGFVLRGNEELQSRILDSALSQFPIIGDQLQAKGLQGSVPALVVGLVGAVWSGLAVLNAAQNAMNQVWDVPRLHQPNLLRRVVRGGLMLAVALVAILVSTGLASLGSSGGGVVSLLAQALAIAGTLAVNFLLFAAAFRFLTVADVSWRDVWIGAAIAAVVWAVLLVVGTWLVGRQVRDASEVYGFFGVVIGLLSWLYLGAQVTLYAAEINVVRAKRLWPRSLQVPPTNEADRRVLTLEAEQERAVPSEDVDVRFGPAARG